MIMSDLIRRLSPLLTAIVVSVSTLAVAVAIIVNIQRKYGTIEEDEILEANKRDV